AHSNGVKADCLRELRKKACSIPEFSLAAEEGNGAIVWQAVLSKTVFTAPCGEREGCPFSPVCVRLAGETGFRVFFLCGGPLNGVSRFMNTA
ncbi:MAG: hypothetical protein FWD39_02545, partial [Clostridiales bacterium]|nr:hypothetical protein [Clostridiales bacterium]